MDRVVAVGDETTKLVESDIAAVVVLERATNAIVGNRDHEQQRFEAREIVIIEWAIDENVAVANWRVGQRLAAIV
jgi:hypothetical protein